MCNNFPGSSVDVLEPDESVIEASRRWFGLDAPVYMGDMARGSLRYTPRSNHTSLPAGCARVVVADGDTFLRESSLPQQSYDAIIIDAFGTDAKGQVWTPPSFGSLEFVAAASRALSAEHGMLLVNNYPDDPTCAALRRHAASFFSVRYSFRGDGSTGASGQQETIDAYTLSQSPALNGEALSRRATALSGALGLDRKTPSGQYYIARYVRVVSNAVLQHGAGLS